MRAVGGCHGAVGRCRPARSGQHLLRQHSTAGRSGHGSQLDSCGQRGRIHRATALRGVATGTVRQLRRRVPGQAPGRHRWLARSCRRRTQDSAQGRRAAILASSPPNVDAGIGRAEEAATGVLGQRPPAPLRVALGHQRHLRQEEGWRAPLLRRLSRVERPDGTQQLPAAAH